MNFANGFLNLHAFDSEWNTIPVSIDRRHNVFTTLPLQQAFDKNSYCVQPSGLRVARDEEQRVG